ncbi:MAG: GTP-binding protein [Pseudoflavonifractor capillosus]|uniref:CobW family GTP-binding protein n=1 Tax=Pseudoflavonifractor capillosus TaxID=106588 RepID=UPI0023F6B8EC|nr:GTP-binding protein [Pseudoflavonifractor capillosus]MCI5929711.1 GTP-binding protein [Pseudoflavonifractor capillosus]MDY4660815.1 GTP-binding protein [Pseudoflavonifractor capillosus]
MSRLYLVTGFLGAGKTTFLKRLVHCFPGQRTALIVNEYGREGVDGTLLSGLGASLTEIDNGSIFCSCRLEQFEEVLRSTLSEKPDVILVEASGLSDPTGANRLLGQREKFSGLTYAGAICLVDAARFHNVYASSGVCRRQLAAADLILINKTDLVSPEQVALVRAEVEAQRPGRPVHETSFGMLDPAWLSGLDAPPVAAPSASRRRLTLTVGQDCSPASLERFLSVFARDTRRIRGFVPLSGEMYLADCVGPQVRLEPWQGEALNPGRLTVLFDGVLPAPKSLWAAMTWYPECHVAVE